jgi:nucleotide-binding universal stress UspA family protein
LVVVWYAVVKGAEMKTEIPSSSQKPYVILAALAFDETGESALREAAVLANQHPHCELHLVHVVREEATASSATELVTLEKRLAHAPLAIQEYVEKIWSELPRKVVAHLRAGQPSRSILQAAVDINADIVVVGTHRRAGLKKLMLGSIAQEVLEHAHCPVLIALPKDYTGKSLSDTIQPPCPDCIEARRTSNGEHYWCERHSRSYLKPHVYEPTQSTRTASVMPTH